MAIPRLIWARAPFSSPNIGGFTGILENYYLKQTSYNFMVNGAFLDIKSPRGYSPVSYAEYKDPDEDGKYGSGEAYRFFWQEVYKYYDSVGDLDCAREAATHLLGCG